jgi:hypothetical protein
MASVRPLRELLADLAGDPAVGDPAAYLAAHGYADLPPDLVAEAVVNYADTASPEVAEHLAPFVTAHTTGDEEPADWFALLSSAPTSPADDLDDLSPEPWTTDDFDVDPGAGLDFGTGALDDPDPTDVTDTHEADESSIDWPVADHEPPTTPAPEPDDTADDFDDFPSDDADEDHDTED